MARGIGIGCGISLGSGAQWSPALHKGTNLKLWLHADLGITTGATFTWRDQSGNGFDAALSTAGKMPTMGTLPNGKAAVVFDGVDDYLANANMTTVPAETHTFAMTVIAANQLTDIFDNTSANRFILYTYNGGNVYFQDTTPRLCGASTAALQSLIFQIDSTTAASCYRDGAVLGSGLTAVYRPIDGGYVLGGIAAGGQTLSGKLRQFMMFSPALPTSEIPLLAQYLRADAGSP